MKLEKFLKIRKDKIILPINEYEFILSRQSAENMVQALRGALQRLTKRTPDGVPPREVGDLTPDDVREKMACLPKPRRR